MGKLEFFWLFFSFSGSRVCFEDFRGILVVVRFVEGIVIWGILGYGIELIRISRGRS